MLLSDVANKKIMPSLSYQWYYITVVGVPECKPLCHTTYCSLSLLGYCDPRFFYIIYFYILSTQQDILVSLHRWEDAKWPKYLNAVSVWENPTRSSQPVISVFLLCSVCSIANILISDYCSAAPSCGWTAHVRFSHWGRVSLESSMKEKEKIQLAADSGSLWPW